METKISEQEFEHRFFKACLNNEVNEIKGLLSMQRISFYQFNHGFQLACHNDCLATVIEILDYQETQNALFIDFEARMEADLSVPYAPFTSACYGGAWQVIAYFISEGLVYLNRDLRAFLTEQKFFNVLNLFDKEKQFSDLQQKLSAHQSVSIQKRKI